MVRGERRVETLTTAKTTNTPTHMHLRTEHPRERLRTDFLAKRLSQVPGLPVLVREEKRFQLALATARPPSPAWSAGVAAMMMGATTHGRSAAFFKTKL